MILIKVLFRTIFFYFFVVLCYRLMGKREIAQLQIIDLIISILMAELIAISIENINDSIYLTICPIILLVILEIIVSKITLKYKKIDSMLDGKPSFLILDGKIIYKELIKNRYSINDLLLELRQKGIKNIKDVEYAILETNGKVSIFKYNILRTSSSYPMPLIIDREIQYDTLEYLKKDKEWLINKIHNKKLLLNDILYCFFNGNKIIYIKKNNK